MLWGHQGGAAEAREPLVRSHQSQGATTKELPRPKSYHGQAAETKEPLGTDSKQRGLC